MLDSNYRLCIECHVRPVQGCRCRIGADYCKICKDAHPGPVKTMDEVMKEHTKKMAENLYDKIGEDILKGPYDNR